MIHRDSDQILKSIQFPILQAQTNKVEQGQSNQANEIVEVDEGVRVVDRKESSPLGGPKFGSNIQDLFSHSYLPPQKHPVSKTRWLWVEAARVWDEKAARYPARAEEVRRLGSRAKFLKKVTHPTIDSRFFVQVLRSSPMESRFQGTREVKDNRDSRDLSRDFVIVEMLVTALRILV